MGKTAASEDLREDLHAGQQQCALHSQKFIPNDVLIKTITAERVRAALYSRFTIVCSGIPAEVAKDGRKLLAILVLLGDTPAMKSLWKQGLRDHHLPLFAPTGQEDRTRMVATDGATFSAWKHQSHAKEFLEKQ